MSGQKLQLKMSVDYISFSAHTDYQQTSEFIRALKPPHVVGFNSNHLSYTASVTAELSQRMISSGLLKKRKPGRGPNSWFLLGVCDTCRLTQTGRGSSLLKMGGEV